MAAKPKENLIMRTASSNRPISGGCDLPCFRPEWLLELHSAPAARGRRGTVRERLFVSHYLWVIFVFQIIAAVLLLANRYVALAVAVLAPVIVNILSFQPSWPRADFHWPSLWLCYGR
jgi:hypothetical protein